MIIVFNLPEAKIATRSRGSQPLLTDDYLWTKVKSLPFKKIAIHIMHGQRYQCSDVHVQMKFT